MRLEQLTQQVNWLRQTARARVAAGEPVELRELSEWLADLASARPDLAESISSGQLALQNATVSVAATDALISALVSLLDILSQGEGQVPQGDPPPPVDAPWDALIDTHAAAASASAPEASHDHLAGAPGYPSDIPSLIQRLEELEKATAPPTDIEQTPVECAKCDALRYDFRRLCKYVRGLAEATIGRR
jgi:hypothetical protein